MLRAIGNYKPCIFQNRIELIHCLFDSQHFTHVHFITYDAFILRLYINNNDVYKLISLYRKYCK